MTQPAGHKVAYVILESLERGFDVKPSFDEFAVKELPEWDAKVREDALKSVMGALRALDYVNDEGITDRGRAYCGLVRDKEFAKVQYPCPAPDLRRRLEQWKIRVLDDPQGNEATLEAVRNHRKIDSELRRIAREELDGMKPSTAIWGMFASIGISILLTTVFVFFIARDVLGGGHKSEPRLEVSVSSGGETEVRH